jgi:hypothetical protein
MLWLYLQLTASKLGVHKSTKSTAATATHLAQSWRQVKAGGGSSRGSGSSAVDDRSGRRGGRHNRGDRRHGRRGGRHGRGGRHHSCRGGRHGGSGRRHGRGGGRHGRGGGHHGHGGSGRRHGHGGGRRGRLRHHSRGTGRSSGGLSGRSRCREGQGQGRHHPPVGAKGGQHQGSCHAVALGPLRGAAAAEEWDAGVRQQVVAHHMCA